MSTVLGILGGLACWLTTARCLFRRWRGMHWGTGAEFTDAEACAAAMVAACAFPVLALAALVRWDGPAVLRATLRARARARARYRRLRQRPDHAKIAVLHAEMERYRGLVPDELLTIIEKGEPGA